MGFVDLVKIKAVAGRGGDGKISFRREKGEAFGGPDGGNGGNGGNIIIRANQNISDLSQYSSRPLHKAGLGVGGGNKRSNGRRGQDLIINVPTGTVVSDSLTGDVLVDLVYDDSSFVIAHGGEGGFGNSHFKSSTNRAPKFAEKGLAGEERTVILELKLIADVGLIGFPNAGKSSLLAALSNAKPKIGNYPFTTLQPQLGIITVKSNSITIADLPGIIEGASQGKGLGLSFLRHIARTRLKLIVLDASEANIIELLSVLLKEIEDYGINRSAEIIVVNKIDLLDDKELDKVLTSLIKFGINKESIVTVSAVKGTGLNSLKQLINSKVEFLEPSKPVEVKQHLSYGSSDFDDLWGIDTGDDKTTVHGVNVEKAANKLEFNNWFAVKRLHNILEKKGIIKKLIKLGVDKSNVYIGSKRLPEDFFDNY